MLETFCWVCINSRKPKAGWRASLLTLARSPAWPFRCGEYHSAVSFTVFLTWMLEEQFFFRLSKVVREKLGWLEVGGRLNTGWRRDGGFCWQLVQSSSLSLSFFAGWHCCFLLLNLARLLHCVHYTTGSLPSFWNTQSEAAVPVPQILK